MDGTTSTTTSTPTTTATTSSIPASTPSAAPSSSGTAAPAQSRPATFEEAFAAPSADGGDAGATSDTSAVTPPVAEGAAPQPPTAEPVTPDPSTPPEPKAGPIPFEAHKRVLENTRRKTEEATLHAVAEVVRPYATFAQQLQTDFVGTITQLIEEAASHPEYGGQIRSVAARTLGGRKAAPAADTAPQPDVVHEETGQAYYSPQRAAELAAWQARQAAQEAAAPLQQQIQPLLQDRAAAAEQKRHEAFVQAEQQRAKTTVSAMRQRPYFKEHETAIRQAMEADPQLTVQEAYAQVVAEIVIPSLQKTTQQSFAAVAAHKAAGATTPPGSAPARPSRPRTFEEAFSQNPLTA